MFTGIVEELGTILAIDAVADGARVQVEGALALVGTRRGDSISIDGACLTVVAIDERSFVVEASLETMRRTSLGDRAPGDAVHLERALGAGGRFGGHFVQGHVDGTGTIRGRETVGDSVVQSWRVPPDVATYLVPKGSIAVDGVSLTVVGTGADWFDAWLIPHTIAATHLVRRPIGTRVNLEPDILAKYVAKAVEVAAARGSGREPGAPLPPGGGGVGGGDLGERAESGVDPDVRPEGSRT